MITKSMSWIVVIASLVVHGVASTERARSEEPNQYQLLVFLKCISEDDPGEEEEFYGNVSAGVTVDGRIVGVANWKRNESNPVDVAEKQTALISVSKPFSMTASELNQCELNLISVDLIEDDTFGDDHLENGDQGTRKPDFSQKEKRGVAREEFSNWRDGDDHAAIVLQLVKLQPSSAKDSLRILQYNIQQRPSTEGFKFEMEKTHSERSYLSTVELPAAIVAFQADVVTINEAFTGALRPELIANMARIGFTQYTDAVNKSSSQPWSGGVMVFSKATITRKAELQFATSDGADGFAAKGAWYVQIEKDGNPYNLFATHANASYELVNGRVPMADGGRVARAEQFKELQSFAENQAIPTNQPVIIVGDMNVDMLSERAQQGDEFASMLSALHCKLPSLDKASWPFTADAKSNQWVDKKEGQQWLDYAVYSLDYLQPKWASMKAINLKAVDGRDLSDHYPLLANFTY